MTSLEHEVAKHEKYPDFVKWLKRNAKTKLKESTIASILQQVECMRNEYELDLDAECPDIESVILDMEESLSAATVNSRRSILRRWLKFLGVKLTKKHKALFTFKKGERKRKIYPKDLLTIQELDDIVQHTESPALRAFYWCLYDTGGRPNALCSLNMSDLTQDRHGAVFKFRNTKTEQSKRPVRLLTGKANQYLNQWLAVHPDRQNPKAPLFINRLGNRYTPSDMTSTLKVLHQERLNRGEGKEKAPLNLYLFRKSRTTHLLKEGELTELQIKMRLGHKKSSRMMERYYAIIDEMDQADAELEYLGVETEKEQPAPQSITCSNCGAINEAESSRCHRCKHPLTEEELLHEQQELTSRTLQSLRDTGDLRDLFREVLAEILEQEDE